MGRPWTPEEDAILREIWKRPEPIFMQIGKLPGRTKNQVQMRARLLKLPKKNRAFSYGWGRIVKLLSDRRARTRNEIAERVALTPQQVVDLMASALKRGDVHIFGWVQAETNGRQQPMFRAGAGQNAPKPPMLTPAGSRRKFYEKMDPVERSVLNRQRRLRYKAKAGKLTRRDPLVAAFFGEASL